MWLLDRTQTAMGGRLLRRWIERPLLSRDQLEARLSAVEALKGDMLLRSDLRTCLDRVYDLERLAGRISYGNANARDLIQLRMSLEAVPELKQYMIQTNTPVLMELANGMDECTDMVNYLAHALVDDPPISVREGGMIRTGYDEYLDKLHTASREGRRGSPNWSRENGKRQGFVRLKLASIRCSAITSKYRNPTLPTFQLVGMSASKLWPMQSGTSRQS